MYEPDVPPDNLPPEVIAYLDNELAKIAYWLNQLIQYNEDNP